MQTISIIVAMSDNNVIGKDNALPWHIPADLKHFKELTIGHPVVMGRKTYDSIGRALPGRKNIIITRDAKFTAPDCVIVHSLQEALTEAGNQEVFVIGGASIYTLALPLAHTLYLTRVHTTIEDGDVFFTFNEADWKLQSEESHPASDSSPAFTWATYTQH